MDYSQYDIIKDIDSSLGSFCTLKLVRRKKSNKELIIKKQHIYSNNYAVNEAQIMNKLNHPNILHFYNSWKKDNNLFILMEYATKGTLYELLNKASYEPMKENDAFDFFCQLTLGVDYMHKQCIMHRDLKPENIMFTDPDRKVKIIDFGLSRDTSTKLNVPMMNPNQYSAPENWEEGVSHTFKSDIWSIGALLYEVVANVDPKILYNNLNALETLPPSTKDVCKKILKVSPHERPTTKEILCYSELKPAISSYYQSLEISEQEIIDDQLKTVIYYENLIIK